MTPPVERDSVIVGARNGGSLVVGAGSGCTFGLGNAVGAGKDGGGTAGPPTHGIVMGT
jgi:hypothetical protein